MPELLTLTTPVAKPSITDYRVSLLQFDWTGAAILVRLKSNSGEELTHIYSGATATALMVALNKANLTNNSLHRRVIAQLIVDGVVTGTISGSPD